MIGQAPRAVFIIVGGAGRGRRAITVACLTCFGDAIAADGGAVCVVVGVASRRAAAVTMDTSGDGGDCADSVTGGGVSRLRGDAAHISSHAFGGAVTVACFTCFGDTIAANRCTVGVVIGVASRRTAAIVGDAFGDV